MNETDDNASWDRLRKQLEALEIDLGDVEILNYEDFERYRLHMLTYGQISSDFEVKLKRGALFLYSRPGTGAHIVNDSLSEAYGKLGTLPRYLVQPTYNVGTLLDRARFAIERQELSLTFVDTWGRLLLLSTMHAVASGFEEERLRAMKQALKGSKNTVEIQKYWFAHWINQHAPSLEPKDRRDAISCLTELCQKIGAGLIRPWEPYPKEWYVAVLDENAEDISEGLRRLTTKALRQMLESELIKPSVLPPLSRRRFASAT